MIALCKVKIKPRNIKPANNAKNSTAVILVNAVTTKVTIAMIAMNAINLKLVMMKSMMYLLFSVFIIVEPLSKVKLYICNHTTFNAP